MIPASERYLHDPVFHQLVDTMYHYMTQLELTPYEMREAVMLAAVKFESTHIRPLMISNGEIAAWNKKMYGYEDPNEKINLKNLQPPPDRRTH